MRKHWSKYLGFLVTGSVLWSLPVQADGLPPQCTSLLSERAYNSGLTTGYSIVSQAWAGIDGDCSDLDDFEAIVINNIEDYQLSAGASQYTVCRYTGHIEGMLRAIDDLYSTCDGQCAQEGRLIGEISAMAYCQLSFALGGLATADEFVREPVQSCGEEFRSSCDLRYNTVTHLFVDEMWDDPETTGVNEGSCKRYTDEGDVLDPETGEPMWEPVWNQVRAIQCGHDE